MSRHGQPHQTNLKRTSILYTHETDLKTHRFSILQLNNPHPQQLTPYVYTYI